MFYKNLEFNALDDTARSFLCRHQMLFYNTSFRIGQEVLEGSFLCSGFGNELSRGIKTKRLRMNCRKPLDKLHIRPELLFQ